MNNHGSSFRTTIIVCPSRAVRPYSRAAPFCPHTARANCIVFAVAPRALRTVRAVRTPALPVQLAQPTPTARTMSAPDRAEGATLSPTPSGETAEEPDDSEEVIVVTSRIINLWTDHRQKSASLKKSKQQLKVMRAKLGKHLFELKNLLAKPGRDGRWTSFLDGEGIPRATADRYVESHKLFLDGENGKRLSEAISIPTEEEIRKMVARLSPRLVRVLTTPESIAQFLHEMGVALRPSGSVA